MCHALGSHDSLGEEWIVSAVSERLDRLIEEYLAGARPFMSFWSAFTDAFAGGEVTEREESKYQEAYDIVYMTGEGAIDAEDARHGLLEEAEARARLTDFRARHLGSGSA